MLSEDQVPESTYNLTLVPLDVRCDDFSYYIFKPIYASQT